MKRILFLDDDPERHVVFAQGHPDAVHVWTYDEACAALDGEPFQEAWLDHDLHDFSRVQTSGSGLVLVGGRELTGADVARFIVQMDADGKVTPHVWVHSWNPTGAERMRWILSEAGVHHSIHPFEFPPMNLAQAAVHDRAVAELVLARRRA